MKVLKWLDHYFEISILSIAVVMMVVTMTAQVVARKIVGDSLSWTEELARYLFIWSGFLSVSLTLRNNTAMKMDILASMLSEKWQKRVYVFAHLLMLIFFVYMAYISILVFQNVKQTSTTLHIPMKWIYFAATLGFSLTIVRVVQNIVAMLKKQPGGNEEARDAG